jgi:hypothetical protein
MAGLGQGRGVGAGREGPQKVATVETFETAFNLKPPADGTALNQNADR